MAKRGMDMEGNLFAFKTVEIRVGASVEGKKTGQIGLVYVDVEPVSLGIPYLLISPEKSSSEQVKIEATVTQTDLGQGLVRAKFQEKLNERAAERVSLVGTTVTMRDREIVRDFSYFAGDSKSLVKVGPSSLSNVYSTTSLVLEMSHTRHRDLMTVFKEIFDQI